MRYALTLAALAVPVLLSAQLPQMQPGTRIRVRTGSEVITGTLMAQTADSMDIAVNDDVHRGVPAASVQWIRIAYGKSAGAGALRGFWLGAVAGGLFGLLIGTNWDFSEREGLAAVGTVAVPGALAGALFGALTRAERWQRIY